METCRKNPQKRGRVNKNVLFQPDTFFKECGIGHEKHYCVFNICNRWNFKGFHGRIHFCLFKTLDNDLFVEILG